MDPGAEEEAELLRLEGAMLEYFDARHEHGEDSEAARERLRAMQDLSGNHPPGSPGWERCLASARAHRALTRQMAMAPAFAAAADCLRALVEYGSESGRSEVLVARLAQDFEPDVALPVALYVAHQVLMDLADVAAILDSIDRLRDVADRLPDHVVAEGGGAWLVDVGPAAEDEDEEVGLGVGPRLDAFAGPDEFERWIVGRFEALIGRDRCQATTVRGLPCANRAAEGSDRCWRHGGGRIPTSTAAQGGNRTRRVPGRWCSRVTRCPAIAHASRVRRAAGTMRPTPSAWRPRRRQHPTAAPRSPSEACRAPAPAPRWATRCAGST